MTHKRYQNCRQESEEFRFGKRGKCKKPPHILSFKTRFAQGKKHIK